MPVETLKTERLELSALRESDVPTLCAIAGQEAILDTTISVPSPFTDAIGKEWLKRYDGRGSAFGWAIRPLSAPGRMIGFVGLGHVDREHYQAEISFWVDIEAAGRGIVTEAARSVIDHAFEQLGLHRIEAYHMDRNPGSGRVLEKLGFSQEGVLRERVLKWGKREDVLLWSRLKSDR